MRKKTDFILFKIIRDARNRLSEKQYIETFKCFHIKNLNKLFTDNREIIVFNNMAIVDKQIKDYIDSKETDFGCTIENVDYYFQSITPLENAFGRVTDYRIILKNDFGD